MLRKRSVYTFSPDLHRNFLKFLHNPMLGLQSSCCVDQMTFLSVSVGRLKNSQMIII